MKRIFSFVLAAVLLVSAVPTALATNDYSQGTQVVYEATGSESYTITVPAQLTPGGSGTVTLSGTWADNRVVTVTADPSVTLTNSIKADDQKVLDVHFDGISAKGSNTGSQTFTEGVSVDDITNALFGTWSGKFNYNVAITDAPVALGCDTLYWDGNEEGRVFVADWMIKVSDDTFTADDVANGFEVIVDGNYMTFGKDFIDMIMQEQPSPEMLHLSGIVVVYSNNLTVNGIVFPETGIYFCNCADGVVTSLTIPGYTGFPHSEHCGH